MEAQDRFNVAIQSPLSGTLRHLAHVPDPVFAEEMLGPGIALAPSSSGAVTATSPVTGMVAALRPHAFVITTDHSFSVLVHLGIDTVTGSAEQFQTLLSPRGEPWQVGDHVEAGAPIIRWTTPEPGATPELVLMTVLDLVPETGVERLLEEGQTVQAGANILTVFQQ